MFLFISLLFFFYILAGPHGMWDVPSMTRDEACTLGSPVKHCPYMHGLIYGLSILSPWCMCLFLCEHHTVLITIVLQYSLKSGIEMPPALFFFFRIALYVWHLLCLHKHFRGFPGGSDDKESPCNAGDLGLIPGLGRSPGEGTGYPLQQSCLENSMDRGSWWATVHGVAKSGHN